MVSNVDFDRRQCDIEYHDRLAHAREMIEGSGSHRVRMVESHIVSSLEEARMLYHAYRAKGYEGAMLKNIDYLWNGKRTNDMVKMKAIESCDLEVIGFKPGKVGSKNEGLVGSLHCISSCGTVEANARGLSDALCKEITENFETEWLGSIVELLYNEKITNKDPKREGLFKLYHPRFVEKRTDKTIADSNAEIV